MSEPKHASIVLSDFLQATFPEHKFPKLGRFSVTDRIAADFPLLMEHLANMGVEIVDSYAPEGRGITYYWAISPCFPILLSKIPVLELTALRDDDGHVYLRFSQP